MEKPSVVLCVLIAVFGIGSWIDINGLWVETPLLVQSAPESWSLPSYLVMIIQIANIGPLIYLLLNKVSKGAIRERPVIYIILSVGCVSCILLSFFWNHTSYLFGKMRSVPLLVLALFLAVVDCTSSLVFLPYLATFPQAYLTALYIGEGCSGLIPGVVGLIQGIGGETVCANTSDSNGTSTLTPVYPSPIFPVRDFFLFLGFMLFASGTAFGLVDCHPKFEIYRTYQQTRVIDRTAINPRRYDESNTRTDPSDGYTESTEPMVNCDGLRERPRLRKSVCIILLILVTWINALANGFLPSLQSYASIPYGNVPYHLSVTLSNIINPVACSITFFLKLKKVKLIGFMTLLGTSLATYITYLAFLSPSPPMATFLKGKIIMVLSWVLLTAIFSYVKTVIGLILQEHGKVYLVCCGFFTQVGSFIGALSSFLIINTFNLLKQAPPC